MKDVTVKGDVNEKYRTIAVEERTAGGKTFWSRAWVERECQLLYQDGASFPGRVFYLFIQSSSRQIWEIPDIRSSR